MTWTQNYDPLASAWLSPLLAAVPVLLLLGLLATGRVSAARAALLGLLGALVVAIFGFAPQETATAGLGSWATTVLAAAGYGAAFGLLPIGWIVVSAIFLYNLTVETGHFDIVKRSVLALSDDRRIQALLIAFCFGAFIEGAAGFGTPVAISAALLLGAGFKPLHAAGLALLANTSPVAFGALGTPITTLAQVTGLDELRLSAMAGRQLPFFSLIVPAWLVWVMAGWRGVIGVWPALLITGGSFALVQYLTANLHGPWLVDVAGGLVSLVSLALFLRVWQPRQRWRFPEEDTPPPGPLPEAERGSQTLARRASEGKPGTPPPGPLPEAERGSKKLDLHSLRVGEGGGGAVASHVLTRRAIIIAWMPWALLTLFVFVWGLPPVKSLGISSVKSLLEPLTLKIEVPALHNRVVRQPPVVPVRRAEPAEYRLNVAEATGTSIFLAAVVSAWWLGVGPRRFMRIGLMTLYRLRWPLFTIVCMLAIAFTTRYSGLDATLGLAFTRTGVLYPLFAALLGWLGVALTGSDTSSNALFGGLQTVTANRLVSNGVLPLSVDQASLLLATANSTGGVMGKMIDAQSIVVSAAATQQPGQEGPILRFVFFHSVALAVLMGLLVMLQAYVWTGAIP